MLLFLHPPLVGSCNVDELVVLRSLRCFWSALAEVLVVVDSRRLVVEIVVLGQSCVGWLVSIAHRKLVLQKVIVSFRALGSEGL